MQGIKVTDEEISRAIEEDIELIAVNPSLIDVESHDGVVHLTGHVECDSDASTLIDMVRRIDGVVRIEARLEYECDDGPGRPRRRELFETAIETASRWRSPV